MTQVKLFTGYDEEKLQNTINDFIKDKTIVDFKMSTTFISLNFQKSVYYSILVSYIAAEQKQNQNNNQSQFKNNKKHKKQNI